MSEKTRTYLIDDPEQRLKMIEHTFASVPHTKDLGVEFISLERNKAIGKLPYQSHLAGNPSTGALHTGVLISLVDTVAGLAVFSALPKWEMVATLDLRLDSFKPSTAGKAVYASVECYQLTRTIAFVRGNIYHDSDQDPIAACVATFFRGGSRQRSGSGESEAKGGN